MRSSLISLACRTSVMACLPLAMLSCKGGHQQPEYRIEHDVTPTGQPNVLVKARYEGQEYTLADLFRGEPQTTFPDGPPWEGSVVKIDTVADIDGDNVLDALVSIWGGGNGAPPEYFVLSQLPGGSMQASPRFNLGWLTHRVVETDKGPALEYDEDEGAVRVLYREGQIQSTERKPASFLSTEAEISTEEVIEQYGDYTEAMPTLQADLNGDGQQDEIACKVWGRSQLLACHLAHVSNQPSQPEDFPSCNRLGVLSSSTRGMRDLVCDRASVLRWDGTRYASPEGDQ